MKQIYPTPSLILIRGLPGSGKSYLTEELVRRLGKESVMVLDPDLIDMQSEEYLRLKQELKNEGVEEKFHPFRFSRARASQGILDGKIIIWSQAFTLLGGFQRLTSYLLDFAKEQGEELPILVVEMSVNPETAKKRIADRTTRGGLDVPPENFERFINDYTSFKSEGFSTVDGDGDGDVSQTADKVLAELAKL